MKKAILGIISVIALQTVVFAQGELQIQNSSSSGTKIYTNGVAGGQSTGQSGALMPAYTVGSYTFLLFVSSTTNSGAGAANSSVSATPWASGSWASTGQYATNGALGGRINEEDNGVGYMTIPSNLFAGIGLTAGVYANVEMIGWNTAVGGSTLSSFITAYNSSAAGLYYGYSSVGNIELGDNGASVANTSIFQNGVAGFTLAPIAAVPEPTTIALAGLGGLALLGLRRKK